MNYYDEEITIGQPDTKTLSNIKVSRLPSGGATGSTGLGGGGSARAVAATGSGKHSNQSRSRNMFQRNYTEDDGLLQEIIDHDDEDDIDDDEDESDMQKPPVAQTRRSASQRPQTRPGSTRAMNLPTAKALDNDTDLSESESDEGATGALKAHGPTGDAQLNITPDNWENLSLNQEVKDIFPYILKYTPQSIDTPYHLQPFIPEYVPAVGDVDAFLKVAIPPLLQVQREHEINDHLRKMGLFFLDEPSGEQSEPSLLNMKLRSVLTGSGVNPRSASASAIPTAKAPKDIDKWIVEVEQVQMALSVYDAQPRKDIEALLLDWPRAYADAAVSVEDAYQRCMQEDISLTEYINELCQRFGVDGAADTQIDYILNIHTLFGLYLAASQAWD